MHNMKSNSQHQIELINVCQWWTLLLFRVLFFFTTCLLSLVPLDHPARTLCMYQIDMVLLIEKAIQALQTILLSNGWFIYINYRRNVASLFLRPF